MVGIQPNGQGGFVLLADGLDGIIAGEIRIDYQANNDSVPVVSAVGLGAQTTFQATTDSPGTVIINLTSKRPLGSGGYLAMVQLSGQENGPGLVTGLSAVLKNENGVEESAGTEIVNPPKMRKPAEASATDIKQIKTKPTVQAPFKIGSLPVKTPMPILASPDALPPQSGALSYRKVKGVLDRFRDFTGELTSSAIEQLFAQVGGGEFHQEPRAPFRRQLGDAPYDPILRRRGGDTPVYIKGGHSDGLQKRERCRRMDSASGRKRAPSRQVLPSAPGRRWSTP